jgi:predicted transposase/invertase (TIGR01784 family)
MQSKYINPFTDYGFKKIFGEEISKKSLISFLNDVLPIEKKIKNVTFLPNSQIGNSEEDRSAIYDIFCEDESGGQFIVEMQNARQTYFKDRTLFYSTFPIQRQAEKGNWNFKLKDVYCVSLLGFEMPGEEKEYLHKVQLKNQNNKVFYEKLNYIYIELPKFNKKINELENHLDKWLYFLKNLEDFEKLPDIFQEEIFIETLERIEIISLSKEEIYNYERSLKCFRDNINIITTAIEEGKEEGRKKGREEGREEERIKIAKEMLQDGETIEKIVKYSKLEIEEIKKLYSERLN